MRSKSSWNSRLNFLLVPVWWNAKDGEALVGFRSVLGWIDSIDFIWTLKEIDLEKEENE